MQSNQAQTKYNGIHNINADCNFDSPLSLRNTSTAISLYITCNEWRSFVSSIILSNILDKDLWNISPPWQLNLTVQVWILACDFVNSLKWLKKMDLLKNAIKCFIGNENSYCSY